MQIISQNHDKPLAGHFGRDRTLDLIYREYWWPNMSRDIATYTRACQLCIQNKQKLIQDTARYSLSHPQTLVKNWDRYDNWPTKNKTNPIQCHICSDRPFYRNEPLHTLPKNTHHRTSHRPTCRNCHTPPQHTHHHCI